MRSLQTLDRQTAAARIGITDLAHSPDLYRQLYISLDLPLEARPAVIGITSAIAGEGRTTVALGLAQTLAADMDMPVAVAEVDLERPTLALRFGVAPAPGLADVLRGDCLLGEVLRPVAENLSVVTTGSTGADAALFMRRLPERDPFHHTPGVHDVVILDLPPIINHGYAPLAARVADAVVLVVRAGITPTAVVREAIARLEGCALQGVVLNGPRSSLPRWWPGRQS